jgi:DNA repair ATPase RecN
MEENNYEYNPEEGYDYEKEENEAVKKSLQGYRVVIILLAIILAGLSILYFNLNRQQQADYALLQADRDTIQSNLTSLINEYDNLKYQNDTIAAQLAKANEMVEQLKRERRFNYNKLKAYQKEVGTLRAVMKNYLRQIDSLNTLNKKVIGENVSLRKEISTAKLRADVAEERASELQNKVAQGSVLRARGITLVALNANDKEITRVKNATTLRADFTVGANELAAAGNRPIYLCITSPDGYLLSTDAMPTFTYQGTKKGYSASREVDYQNEDLDVSIFYKGSGFIPGTYKVELYMGNNQIGSTEIVLR